MVGFNLRFAWRLLFSCSVFSYCRSERAVCRTSVGLAGQELPRCRGPPHGAPGRFGGNKVPNASLCCLCSLFGCQFNMSFLLWGGALKGCKRVRSYGACFLRLHPFHLSVGGHAEGKQRLCRCLGFDWNMFHGGECLARAWPKKFKKKQASHPSRGGPEGGSNGRVSIPAGMDLVLSLGRGDLR